MKITQDNLQYIQNVVKTAKLVNIDNIIIEPEIVRAIDDDKTVVILQTDGVPTMEFGSIGINRISVFTSRLDIVRTQENFTIEADVGDDDFVRSLTMKAKGTKAEYRCANPTTISAPKKVNDTMKYQVNVDAESIVMLQKAQAAMDSDVVTFVSNGNGVSFEFVDINNDVFSHQVTTEVTCLTDDEDTKFAHRYPVKILLPLLKSSVNGSVSIGQKGIMSINVNGLNVFVIPQV